MIIPHKRLSPEALNGLIEEFVTRHGTDTGYVQGTLEKNFKRLGFLLEKTASGEADAIKACSERLTTGNACLDSKLNNDKLITRWRLWGPENWKRMEPVD